MDSKTKLLVIILGIVLFAVGFGAGYLCCYAIEKNGKPGKDRDAYKALEGSYDVQAYEDFLSDYPDSPRAGKVRERKEQLEDMAEEWTQIQAIGNIGDFLNFKANYGNPHYNRLCDMKIDSLEYVNARTSNTMESYKAYLRKYPHGRYVEDANEAINGALKKIASQRREAEASEEGEEAEVPGAATHAAEGAEHSAAPAAPAAVPVH